jgi:hypothetical protein
MIAERLIALWRRVSVHALASRWHFFDDLWGREEPVDDEATDADDGDYQQQIILQDLLDH